MTRVVFISYSHDSEAHRERVLGLSERLRADGIETRLDQYVGGTPAEGWPRWMLDRLDEADFVLVVCTETYYRRFRGHEVQEKGKGVDFEGALITQELYDAKSRSAKFVPVLFSGDDESFLPEPFIPEPLRGRTWYPMTSEAGYGALYDFLLGQAGVEPGEVGEVRTRPRRQGTALAFGEPQKIAPSKLKHAAATLFGRDQELAFLDAAWDDDSTHVVTLVAWGGVGKTSLVARWVAGLAGRDFDGADYFDWSFYSQGTREAGGASADAFVASALKFFGDAEMAESAASPWDKGARLAQLAAEKRALLVLDGLEPLQHPPGPLAGELKDPAVSALLKGLAAKNPGLCVVTTREPVEDLAPYRETTAPEQALAHLPVAAGVALLESLGVQGAEDELVQLVEDVGGHALTLDLLGRFLARAYGGDVRQRDRVALSKADLKTQGGHAFRTMAAYETWLAAGGEEGARQVAVLRLLGLFDRPADAGCLGALRREPAITGLTEPLAGLDEEDWNLTVSALVDCGLVVPEGSSLDAHPLIREYFGRELRRHRPEAWRAAHGRLFDHLQVIAEHQPDTLEGLQPLYQAVAHGCQAGRQQEACDKVYYQRISRGAEAYVVMKLGAFGADLGAVASFFERPWSRVSPALTEADQPWLLNQTAYRLRALGRLGEAVEPMRVSMEMDIERKEWQGAAISASNLSELELTLGDVGAAERDAEQSVDFADRSGDWAQRMGKRTRLGDALHQAGRRVDALASFRKAEAIQAESQPAYPLLYSQQGFNYCELLLAGPERAAWQAGSTAVVAPGGGKIRRDAGGPGGLVQTCRDVEKRAAKTHRWVEQNMVSLLDFALNHLTLARTELYCAILERADPAEDLAESAVEKPRSEIEQAVDGLRRAGVLDYLPRGLLTRAWLHALTGDRDGARRDLDEAWTIVERGPMPLFQADVQLHRARLFGDRAALVEARRLIDKHGYRRRREELEDAEEAAADWEDQATAGADTVSGDGLLMNSGTKRFQVALSFPGVHRAFVEQVAQHLAEYLGSDNVLYDRYYEAEFARPDLDTYLQALYHEESELIAVFLCADYERKEWCGLEWRAIRDLIKTRQGSAVMLLRFDNTAIPGLFSTDGYIWVDDRSPQEVADLILQRLARNAGLPAKPAATASIPAGASTPPSPSRPSSSALAVWKEKLQFLQTEEATTVDPDQKFRLSKLIAEAKEKIREHQTASE